MNEKAYYESVNTKNELKLRELQKELPPFCREFFIGMKASVSSRTLLAYAYDLGIFFDFIHQNNPICAKKPVNEFTIDLLDHISPMDIEEYLDYFKDIACEKNCKLYRMKMNYSEYALKAKEINL